MHLVLIILGATLGTVFGIYVAGILFVKLSGGPSGSYPCIHHGEETPEARR